MRHEFQFTFDIAFIKAALRRDVLWKGYVRGGAFLVVAVIMRWVYGHWEPLITGALVLGSIFIVWRFHSHLGTIARRVFDMWTKLSPAGVIRLELDDEGLSVVHENSRSRFAWQGLRRLWRYDDVWLVEIVKMQSVFFPPDQVREEVRNYIVERCRAAGVRV